MFTVQSCQGELVETIMSLYAFMRGATTLSQSYVIQQHRLHSASL